MVISFTDVLALITGCNPPEAIVAAIWLEQSGVLPHPAGSQLARVAQLFDVAFCHVIEGGVEFSGVPCQLNVNPTVVFDQLFILKRNVAVIPAGTNPAWLNGGV